MPLLNSTRGNKLNWFTKIKELGIGDYLIQTKSGQYMAGYTKNDSKGVRHFVSSDGSWRVEITDIKKFVEIE